MMRLWACASLALLVGVVQEQAASQEAISGDNEGLAGGGNLEKKSGDLTAALDHSLLHDANGVHIKLVFTKLETADGKYDITVGQITTIATIHRKSDKGNLKIHHLNPAATNGFSVSKKLTGKKTWPTEPVAVPGDVDTKEDYVRFRIKFTVTDTASRTKPQNSIQFDILLTAQKFAAAGGLPTGDDKPVLVEKGDVKDPGFVLTVTAKATLRKTKAGKIWVKAEFGVPSGDKKIKIDSIKATYGFAEKKKRGFEHVPQGSEQIPSEAAAPNHQGLEAGATGLESKTSGVPVPAGATHVAVEFSFAAQDNS